MLTEKDYCDYETCVALKDLGFKDSTEYYYANNGEYTTTHDNWHSEYTQCWSLYEAQKWLREEKNIDISVTISPFEYFATIREFVFWRGEYSWKTPPIYPNGAKTYEEALSEGIKEAVEILKEKQDGLNKTKSTY